MFFIAKKEKRSSRAAGDFRFLNAYLERTPCHNEPTRELLAYLGVWLWVSAFDLNMGQCAM